MTTQKPRYVAAKQGVVHVKSKLEMAKKTYANAQRAAEAHERNVAALLQKLRCIFQIVCGFVSIRLYM